MERRAAAAGSKVSGAGSWGNDCNAMHSGTKFLSICPQYLSPISTVPSTQNADDPDTKIGMTILAASSHG